MTGDPLSAWENEGGSPLTDSPASMEADARHERDDMTRRLPMPSVTSAFDAGRVVIDRRSNWSAG